MHLVIDLSAKSWNAGRQPLSMGPVCSNGCPIRWTALCYSNALPMLTLPIGINGDG